MDKLEELKGLFEATGIPSDKQEEFSSIFEAAATVYAKELAETEIAEAKEKMDAELEEQKGKVAEYAEYVREEYATKLDEYLDYTVSKWLEENKLAVDSGLKAQMFDNMVESLKGVFAENNIEIAEEKVDVVAELEESLTEAEVSLDEVKKENIELRKQIKESQKIKAIEEACAELTETQKERVESLAEEIDFDESFGAKLSTIVESVSTKVTKTEDDDADPSFIKEEAEEDKKKPSRVSLYAKAAAAESNL